MGLTSSAAAEQQAKLAPVVVESRPAPGHGRGAYVDRSRTDSAELRGLPAVGRGVAGAISRPGIDNATHLERDESSLKRAILREARGNLKRARRKDHHA